MAYVIIGPFKVHDATTAQQTLVTDAMTSCTWNDALTIAAGYVHLYFTQTPLLPGSTTTRAWGYSWASTRIIKINPLLTDKQSKYTILHELGHIVDYDMLNSTERGQIKTYLDPAGEYSGWREGPYRWHANECFAHDFAAVLYDTRNGGLVDYYHRSIDPGDAAAVRAIIAAAVAPDAGDDTDEEIIEDVDEPSSEQESGDASDASNIASAILTGDIWLFVGEDRDPLHIMELPVLDEEHTRPIQQEAFEPLGSDRKLVLRGFVLGHEGTIQAIFSDNLMVPSEQDEETLVPETLRGRRLLEYLSNNKGPHTLKSPFGDTWEVEFEGPKYKWIGGGHLQVDLSWTEIGETSRLLF